MKQLSLLVIFLAAGVSCELWKGTTGSVHGTGRLLCNGEPYANQQLQLWKKNWVRFDNLMADTTTDTSGFFSMKGSISDWYSVDPYIYIPNYCGAVIKDGTQCTESVVRVHFPDHFIQDGNLPTHTFTLGSIEMLGESKTDLRGLRKYLFPEIQCRGL